MILLGIETSCDETSVCLLKDGCRILSLLTSSQISFHEKYGGIVPEIASRQHAEMLPLLLHEALQNAGVVFDDVRAIAVTCGPGLEGALLVGVSFAKALAFAKNIPLIGINHLEGHIYANFLSGKTRQKKIKPPFLALIASGGHSEIVHVLSHGTYSMLGETVDDAAGECLDKIARALGLGFPGGAVIEKLAKKGNPDAIHFPRAALKGKPYHFSFSGLKTSVLRWLDKYADCIPSACACPHADRSTLPPDTLADVCASFQEAVMDALSKKTIKAAVELKMHTVLTGGGVAINKCLRKKLSQLGVPHSINVIFPDPEFCADNAAMIACAAYHTCLRATCLPRGGAGTAHRQRSKTSQSSKLDLTIYPQLRL